ncbi:MAG: hypothetical protein V1886_00735 [archaeon]
MTDNSQLKSLSQLNQEMSEAALKLEKSLDKKDSIEAERLKSLILVLQKKFMNLLH